MRLAAALLRVCLFDRRTDRIFDLVKMCLRVGLAAKDEDRLRIRGANQAPAILEFYTSPVDRIHFVVGCKSLRDALYYIEFLIVRAIDADLGRREGFG